MTASHLHEIKMMMIEDSESDAALIVHEVERLGYHVTMRRLETAAELTAALAEDWHVIISDYRMPQFNALAALGMLHKSGKDIPFIVVSQAIGEDQAVELMRAGAHDYVMKENLTRLVPVIEREMREARRRAQAREAALALETSEINFRLLAENSADVISRHAPDGTYIYVSPAFERIYGYKPEDQIGHSAYAFIHPEEAAAVRDTHEKLLQGPTEIRTEYRLRKKDGTYVWVQSISRSLADPDTRAVTEIQVTTRDISVEKLALANLAESEKRLKAQESFLSSVISSQINGVVVVSASGEINIANDAAAAILELKRDQVTGRYFQEADYWSQIDTNYDPILSEALPLAIALSKQQPVQNFEHGIQLPDGKTKWLSVSASPIHNPDGGLYGAVASFIDVTEQHLSAHKMQRQLERLRLQEKAISSSMSGVIIADARLPDMPVTYVNDAFTQITGYEPKDVIGRNCRFLHGGDRNQIQLQALRAALRAKEAGEYILRNYRKNGSAFYANLTVSPVTNPEGVVTHFVAIQTDITDKFEAERHLEVARERMQMALNGAQLGLIDTDLETGEDYYSPRYAEIIGYSTQELQAMQSGGVWNLIHPDDAAGVRKAFEDHVQSLTASVAVEYRTHQKDGKWVWVRARGRIFSWTANGKPKRFTGTLLDITDSKKQEQNIIELTRKLMDATETQRAEISGELHDNIGQSLVLAKLATLKFLGDHQLRSAKTEQQLIGPINDALNKVREISRELTPVHLQKVGLPYAIEDMVQSAASVTSLKTVLKLSALEGFFHNNWSIECYRLLQECLTNTLKHAHATQFSILTQKMDNNLEITVADNGRGLPAVMTDNGIGLGIMRERVRAIGGQIFFDSTPTGLTIRIIIPPPHR